MTSSSLPTQGAWIEIQVVFLYPKSERSLPTQGAWIEIIQCTTMTSMKKSLPTQGAWIEMSIISCQDVSEYVAPYTGSVD